MLKLPPELLSNILHRLPSTTLAHLSLTAKALQSQTQSYLKHYQRHLTLIRALERQDVSALIYLVDQGRKSSLDVFCCLVEKGANYILREWIARKGLEPWDDIRPILKHISLNSSYPNSALEQSYGILITYYYLQGQPISDWQQLYFLHYASLADAVIDHLSFDDARIDYAKFPTSPSTMTAEQRARYLQRCKEN
jgi:hypothetical protein